VTPWQSSAGRPWKWVPSPTPIGTTRAVIVEKVVKLLNCLVTNCSGLL
jgi:hypothetical protein